ncbi:MAG: alpha/beta fold hydrolase [Actinomycetota bacterium]|nr:alpha/beta fold hydrolase [Actinomycetota bacterium]
MTRTDVTFSSHGADCAAWLYRPDGDGPHPIVVMAHGFSCTRDQRLDAFAERYAEAGFGVLLFDYRFFGASGGEPRQLLDIAAQLDDWRLAIAFARTIDWADQHRIALFGSSFSGGHVVQVASEDSGIAAIVSQCPFSDGLATLSVLGWRNVARLAAHAVADQVGAWLGRPPHYIPAVAPPGSLAVMSSEDSQEGFDKITSAGTAWQNRVAARIGLHVGLYRPGTRASKVTCPALWSIADRDSLCPANRTATLAAKAPRAEIIRYPEGHFDIYVGALFEKAVSDQLAFLANHLFAGRTPGTVAPGEGRIGA